MKTYNIALIPGDGIGKDVTSSGMAGAAGGGQTGRFRP